MGTQSKKDSKDQESIQSSTTPNPGYHVWEGGQITIRHHKPDPGYHMGKEKETNIQ